LATKKSEIDSNKYLSNPNKELFNAVYPNIEKNFNQSQSNAHQLDIKKFIDKNNEVLFASGPTYRLYFNDDERAKLFPHISMRQLQLEDVIKKDKTVEKSWYFMTPFYLVCSLIIRYYMLNKMTKQMENTITYMCLSLYAGRHFISFKYPPNENVMNYTVNNLSNKFKLKQYGTLITAIKDTGVTCHSYYTEYLERGTDVLLNSYIKAMHTRISGFVNNIAEEYYKNYQEGNYLNNEEDNYDEENYYIADNDSFVIDRITNNTTTRIITKGIDYKLVKLSANMCG
jgi:hypothetical protein